MAWLVSVDSFSVPSVAYTNRDKKLCIRRWANGGHSSSVLRISVKNKAENKQHLHAHNCLNNNNSHTVHVKGGRRHYDVQRANSIQLHYDEVSSSSSSSSSSIILGFWIGPDVDDDGWGFIDALVDRIS